MRKKRRTHYVRIPVVGFAALVIAVAGLTILLWSAERGADARLNVKNPGDFAALLPSIVGLTQSSLDGGNRAQVLENGDQFFPALLADIRAARESVHIESYVWWSGAICDLLAKTLAEKAAHGVEVRILVDASGGHKMDRKLAKHMTEAGCRIRRFHTPTFGDLGRLNNRDHRKQAIIDGRIGYIEIGRAHV